MLYIYSRKISLKFNKLTISLSTMLSISLRILVKEEKVFKQIATSLKVTFNKSILLPMKVKLDINTSLNTKYQEINLQNRWEKRKKMRLGYKSTISSIM